MKRMKRKTWTVCLALLCLALLLTGCGKEQPAKEQAAQTEAALTCAQWADRIQGADEFAQMTDVNEKYLEKALLIQASALSDWAFRRDGEGATPEMILVLRVKDGEDKAAVVQAAKDYLEERILQYRDYQPDQLFKLENAKIMVRDDLIALSVSPDAEKAAAALGAGWKREE